VVSRVCFFAVRNYPHEVGLRDYLEEEDEKSPDTLGISLEEMSDELRENLQTADIVIAKGQFSCDSLILDKAIEKMRRRGGA